MSGPDLLSFYVGVDTFKKRSTNQRLFTEMRGVIYVPRVSLQLTRLPTLDSFHDTLLTKFFKFLTHVKEKQQLNDRSGFYEEKSL